MTDFDEAIERTTNAGIRLGVGILALQLDTDAARDAAILINEMSDTEIKLLRQRIGATLKISTG